MSHFEFAELVARVADKRHGRLCLTMPEKAAAHYIIGYLNHLAVVHKLSPVRLSAIASLKACYEEQL